MPHFSFVISGSVLVPVSVLVPTVRIVVYLTRKENHTF